MTSSQKYLDDLKAEVSAKTKAMLADLANAQKAQQEAEAKVKAAEERQARSRGEVQRYLKHQVDLAVSFQAHNPAAVRAYLRDMAPDQAASIFAHLASIMLCDRFRGLRQTNEGLRFNGKTYENANDLAGDLSAVLGDAVVFPDVRWVYQLAEMVLEGQVTRERGITQVFDKAKEWMEPLPGCEINTDLLTSDDYFFLSALDARQGEVNPWQEDQVHDLSQGLDEAQVEPEATQAEDPE